MTDSTDFDDALLDTTYPEMCDLAVLSVGGKDPSQACNYSGSYLRELATSHERLGRLSILPVELLDEILRSCDIHSLTIVRRLCRRSRQLVDESFPFNILTTTTPRLLATVLETGAASYYTADDVFAALRSSSCCICGHFGSLLFLPDCERCCMRCLRFSAEMFPMRLTAAVQLFGLTESELRSAGVPFISSLLGARRLPHLPQLPSVAEKRITFVSESAARQAAERHYGGPEELNAHIDSITCPNKLVYTQRQARIERETRSDVYLSPGEDRSYNNKCRLYAATHLPYLAALSPKPTIEQGLSCMGCQDIFFEAYFKAAPRKEIHTLDVLRERLHTRAQFAVHLETCEGAKAILRGERVGGGKRWSW